MQINLFRIVLKKAEYLKLFISIFDFSSNVLLYNTGKKKQQIENIA